MLSEPELTKNIKSKDDFINFLKALIQDYEKNGANWENNDIGNYLDAVGRFCDNVEGFYCNRNMEFSEQPNWKMFAIMLSAARYI